MKKLWTILVLALVLLLAACGDSTTEKKEVSSVDSGSETEKSSDDQASAEESDTEKVDKVIADDEYIKATLVSVEHKVDKDFDEEKYTLNIDLENKTEKKIVVQSEDVSIDGTMVDDMVFFSEDIAGGKKSKGKLDIQNYEGELPEMNEDIEFKLIILDDETFDTIAEHDVKVDF